MALITARAATRNVSLGEARKLADMLSTYQRYNGKTERFSLDCHFHAPRRYEQSIEN
jgi:hypothetical protein